MSTYGTNKQVGSGGGGGGGGANTALSNLTSPTAINQDLLPGVDGTINLGGATERYAAGYISGLHVDTITAAGGAGLTLRGGTNNAIDLIASGSGNIVLLTDAGGAIQMASPSVLFFGATADMGSGTIINLVDPTNPQDAATKAYVDSKAPGAGTVTSVSVVAANGFDGTVATATSTPAITLTTTITGLLKGDGTAISAQAVAALTAAGTDGIAVTGGSGAVLGAGTSIAQHVADSTHNGYLSSADWSTFSGKQAAGNYITALTGDGTASGPGSAAFTLATVNSNVGSFGSATQVAGFTVDAKGRLTAASNTSIQIAESQVTNLTTDLAAKMTNPMTTAGDMIIGGASGAPTRLASGAARQYPTGQGSGVAPIFQGSLSTIQSKSANYTVLATDGFMIGDATSAAFTFTLPAGGTSVLGIPFTFKKKDSDTSGNAVTVTDGTFSTTLNTAGEIVVVAWTGSAYEIVDRRIPSAWASDSGWTINSFGTVTNQAVFVKREGDSLRARIYFTAGTTTASTASITPPSKYTIATSKVPATLASTAQLGSWWSGNSSATPNSLTSNNDYGPVFSDGTTNNAFYFAFQGASAALVKNQANNVAGTNNGGIGMEFSFPVTGWNG